MEQAPKLGQELWHQSYWYKSTCLLVYTQEMEMEQAPQLRFQPEVEAELGGVSKTKAKVLRTAAPSQASTPQRALLVLKYLPLGTKISI